MNERCNTLARHNKHIFEKRGIKQQVTCIYIWKLLDFKIILQYLASNFYNKYAQMTTINKIVRP